MDSVMNEDLNENLAIETESGSPAWSELLINSAVPAAAVAVKLAEDSSMEIGRNSADREKRSLLTTFHRRTFSRISFKGENGPLLSRYRQTRFSTRRVRKRVVFKHGDCNVVQGNVAKRRRRYLQDIFTTLVDAQWRWTLLVFSMNFLLSWLGFALIWWLIAYSHGDLDPGNYDNPNISFTPCVDQIKSFTSCFLFSVETQHTIGYGSKHTTDECAEAIFVMCIQSMTGVILQAFMVGIVFAKLSRPKKRTQTLLFSRNAVICQRDGQPCLMFRVGDMRKSHIIEAHVRAQMIKRKVTQEGELLPFFQTELKVGGDGEEDKIFFIWPTTIVHKINQDSPLYHISASDMLRERFEIVVILEGVIESTGMTTQARSSYLPSEILWGHRFEHIITFRKETGEYEVNYTLFNNTYEVDTPLCSAADLDHFKSMHRAKGERMSSSGFPAYRDASSSSLTTSSGSSIASSSGGLHMSVAMPVLPSTPPNPIPVMITSPDGSSRRDSVNIPLPPSRQGFYDEPNSSSVIADVNNVKGGESTEAEEDYTRALEDINASLRKNRRRSLHGKEERRPRRDLPKITLDSKQVDAKINSETLKRSTSRLAMDQGQSHGGLVKKSPSRSTLDSKPIRFTDSPDRNHEPVAASVIPRRSSLSDGHRPKDAPKKTSFIVSGNDQSETRYPSMRRAATSPKLQRLEMVDMQSNHDPRNSRQHSRPREEV